MAKIGYERVSSKDQQLARQISALEDVSKLFSDKLSGQIHRTTAIKSDVRLHS